MKKIIILLITGAFILTSCSSDDDAGIDTALVVGVWNLSSENGTATTSGSFNGQNLSSTAVTQLISSTKIVAFNADNTYSASGTTVSSVIQDGVALPDLVDSESDQGTYTITGNVITIASNNSSGPTLEMGDFGTIRSLTATRMEVFLMIRDSSTFPGVVVEVEATQVFTK